MNAVLVVIGCYISGQAGPNLLLYRLDLDSGQLTQLSATGDVRNPAWLDIHPNGRFLYAVSDIEGRKRDEAGAIATYALDAQAGSVRLLGQQLTGSGRPCHVAVHPAGTCLLVANYGGGNACVMPIRDDFTVGETTDFIQYEGSGPNPKRQERPHPHSGVFSPDGQFAYIQDLGTDHIRQYRIDPERGKLRPLDPAVVEIAPGSGPRHFAFHPNGRYGYLINELLNTVTCVGFDAISGQLTPFQTVGCLPAGFDGTSYCADIHLTPDGRFLYGSNRGHDSLVICRADAATGRLAVVGHHPTGGNFPRGFGIDPSGRYAVVANQNDDNVLVFAIDAETGALSHTGCVLDLPKPVCVKMLPITSKAPRRTKIRSVSDMPERQVVIAQSDGDYISFPDVCVTRGGRLICVYRVADKHVATRSRMEVKTSEDGGKTWSDPFVLSPERAHCARLAVMEDGEVLLITDSSTIGGAVYRSRDEGRTWLPPVRTGFEHGIPDRPLRIGRRSLLSTGHRHIARDRHPLLGQATSEQMIYRSDDLGGSWRPWAVLACDPYLVLCEASMFKMPDGSLRAYFRENAGVQEPAFVSQSRDEGRTWSPYDDAPFIGHRPCAGLLRSGKTLATYRHVGPNGGNRAWLGDVDADRFYAVSAFDVGNGARLTSEGLVVENESGDRDAVLYCLRPMTDPRTASARFEVELAVQRNEGTHCGVHFGCDWRFYPDRVAVHGLEIEPVALDATTLHRYAFTYEQGLMTLAVDGERKLELNLLEHGRKLDRDRRAIRIGNVRGGLPSNGPFSFAENGGRSVYRSMRLHLEEPRFRTHAWSWTPADGLPNQVEVDHILELQNDRHSPAGDFGYSGWTQLANGDVFCTVHYRGGKALSYVVGCWFSEDDFGR